MNFLIIIALAVGLSMDAFAVSICIGLSTTKATLKKALIVGLYFGIFQAGMPLIGYAIATQFAEMIMTFSHWIAFGLLCFIGIKMIINSTKKEKTAENETSLSPKKMLPLAVATSIDALAVGASFAILKESVIPIVIATGIGTFILSAAGVKIGNIFGIKYKSKAELAGGIILILIGLNILLEGFGIKII